MKMNKNKFNLDERLNKYNKDSAQLMYDLASDLLNQVSDEDILKLYKDNDIFSVISTMSNEEILDNIDMLKDTINILITHLKSKSLTEEEYDCMTLDEIILYISNLIEDKSINLFDIIKYLEQI